MKRSIFGLMAVAALAVGALSLAASAHAEPMLASFAQAASHPDLMMMSLAVLGGAAAAPVSEALAATEAYSASKATAPRVSLADMEGKIARQHYFTAGDAVAALAQPTDPNSPLDLLTICILVMENGFSVIGKSAPASAENFDAEKGRTFAYEDAIKQLWPLEGYALRERLAQDA